MTKALIKKLQVLESRSLRWTIEQAETAANRIPMMVFQTFSNEDLDAIEAMALRQEEEGASFAATDHETCLAGGAQSPFYERAERRGSGRSMAGSAMLRHENLR